MMDDSNNNLDNKPDGDDHMTSHGRDYDDVIGLKDLYRMRETEEAAETYRGGHVERRRSGGNRSPSPVPSPTEYPRGVYTMSGGSVSVLGEEQEVKAMGSSLNGGSVSKTDKHLYGDYQAFFDNVDINQNSDRKGRQMAKDDDFGEIIKPPEIPSGMRLTTVSNQSGTTQPQKNSKSVASGKPRTGCAPIREAVDPAKYVTIREPDGTKYACSKCGNIYKWRKSLNKHWKEKHEGEIPDPRPNLTPINIPHFRSSSKPEVSLPSSVQRGHPFAAGAQGMKLGQDMGPSAPTIARHLNRPTIPDLELYSSQVFADRFSSFDPSRKMSSGGRVERDRELSKPHRRSAPYPSPNRDPHSGMVTSGNRSGMSSHHPPRGMKTSMPLKASPVAPPSAYTKPSSLTLPVFTPMDAEYLTERRRSPSPKRDFSEDMEVLDLSKKGSHMVMPPRMKMEAAPPQDEPLDFSMKPSTGQDSEMPSAFQKFVKPDYGRIKDDEMGGMYLGDQSSSLGLQCPSCAYVGRDKQDYDNHMELHVRKRHHKCAECQQVFFSVDDLNRHFLRKHIELVQSKLHGTSPDGSPLKPSDQPKAPQLYHYLTTDSKQLLTCMVCGAIYQWQWTLAKHFDEDHPSIPNPYGRKGQRTQPHGGYGDGYEPSRDSHTPDEGDPLQCNQCDFRAGSASEQARHQLKHSINRTLVCKMCGFTTRWREELAQHHIEAHDINPLELGEEADDMMSFIAPGTGQVIDLTAEDTAIVIPQAPEDTALMEQTNTNKGTRSNNKKPGSGAGSSSAETLLPFKCSVCEYRARWPSEITQHMKNHSDEKPYLCPRCSYRSKWKWDVVKHLKRCGGGTVKDVIDTTKQKKQQEVKALLADVLPPSPGVKTANQSSGFVPDNGREVLSNGPPNVTVIPTIPSVVMAEDLDHLDDLNLSTNSNSSFSERGPSPSNSSPTAKKAGSKQGGGQVRGLVNHGQHYCLQCPFVGNSPAELKRHSRVHSDAKPFICKTCGYCSKWKCDLKKHLKTYNHTSAVPLVYGGHGRKPADWYGNKEKGDGEEDEDPLEQVPSLYKSPQRSDDSNKSMGDEQARTPTRGKGSKLKCKQCEYEADDLSSFLQHKKSHSGCQGGPDTPVHSRDSRSVTPSNLSECEQASVSSQSTKHRRKASTQHRIVPTAHDNFEDSDDDQETNEEGDSDDPADYSSNRKSSLPVGTVTPIMIKGGKGSKVPNYQCDLCAYTTDSKSNFEKHNRCHNALSRYSCEWCNWSTNTLNLLYRHAQTVHANELAQQEKDAFYGKIKDRGGDIRGSLGFGVKRPSSDSPTDDVEGGSEGLPETLPPRMGTSKRRRRLKTCPKCGYVTDNVTTLQRHMAKHGSNGKFTCEQCDYSVDRLHVLQYHVKIVHDAVTANERLAVSLVGTPKSPKPEGSESLSEMDVDEEPLLMMDIDKEAADDDTDFHDTAEEDVAGSSGEDTDVYAEREKTGAPERRTSARAVGSRRSL